MTDKNRLIEERLKAIISRKESELRCNCDLDNWEPDKLTGHSSVCRIHKAVLAEWNRRAP